MLWGKAGEGNRTLIFSLEGCCSTIELRPRIRRVVESSVVSSGHPFDYLTTRLFDQATTPVGAPGFEPGTSASQTLRADRAALRPALAHKSIIEMPCGVKRWQDCAARTGQG